MPTRNKPPRGLVQKWCTACSKLHKIRAFKRVPGNIDGLDRVCKNTRKAERKARWAALTESERVAFNLSLLYGISIEQYNQMREEQNYRCAICGLHESESKAGGPNPNVRRLHLDHDHKTGEPRGLLCRDCNTMIGNARDDPARLRGGIEYLRRWALKRLDDLQQSLSA